MNPLSGLNAWNIMEIIVFKETNRGLLINTWNFDFNLISCIKDETDTWERTSYKHSIYQYLKCFLNFFHTAMRLEWYTVEEINK